MLLQSGHHLSADHLFNQSDTTKSNSITTSNNSAITTTTTTTAAAAAGNGKRPLEGDEITRYLDLIQDTLKDGWTVHATKEGRLYYCK